VPPCTPIGIAAPTVNPMQQGSAMADLRKLDNLARVGRDFIGLQLRLTPDGVAEAIDQRWVLGYCFGVLDAVGQRAQLQEQTEELAVIAVGFVLLMADETKGARMMQQALDSQDDPGFVQGALRGGRDMFAWLADTENAPRGLSDVGEPLTP
jgi:hypothetical protein